MTTWRVRWAVWVIVGLPTVVYSQSRVFDTKHNLTVAGTGSIKATTEDNTCVFCHTPHTPQASSQLWNHKLSTATYELYSSDYLTSLNYSAPSQPKWRSKLCLSCHDGTVAIGAVYNNQGQTSIAMQNGVSAMPAGSPGNLGTSLANDHPVGFVFENAKDPELVTRTWPWKTPVQLDPDASDGTIECQTCHDPHDNTNTKFLRISDNNSSLCAFCHTKAGWASAIHKTSTQNFLKADSTTTTVGEWACRNCHQSHGGAGIPYLLKSFEENTCLTSGCHGKTGTGGNTKDIQSEYEKLYTHPTFATSAKHRNPDDAASLGSSSRHAECQDCHNSHQAQKGLHTAGDNGVSSVLLGARGVLPGPTNEWQQPTAYTEMKPVNQENQICLKCHSSYAFGQVFNGITAIVGPSGTTITDQAMEFNSANHSAHPVEVSLNNQTGSLVPKALASTAMTAAWSSVGTQSMYCSDCHGNDQPTSATVPQGPHGANSRFMLTGRGKFWPTNALGTLWSLDDIKNGKNNWQNDLFCANCHTMTTGVSFLNNVHESANHQGAQVKCITCHVAVPHGAKRSRLIGYASDQVPYNYGGAVQFENLVIVGFQKAIDPFQYQKENCSMNGVCHGTQFGTYEP